MVAPGPEVTASRELLARAQAGDRTALEELGERYLPRLRRWARGRLPRAARGEVDTDDVVQDTWLGTLGRLGGFEDRGEGAFAAYLRQAVSNRIRDAARRVRRRPPGTDPGPDARADEGPSALEEVVGREALARYEAALRRLPEADRAAVVARVELDLPWTEAAAVLGRPSPDAARMAVTRALVRLAREMDRDRA